MKFRQYCKFKKSSRLSLQYDNTKFHVVFYYPESPTPSDPHSNPHPQVSIKEDIETFSKE
jgi:hypothetical protein